VNIDYNQLATLQKTGTRHVSYDTLLAMTPDLEDDLVKQTELVSHILACQRYVVEVYGSVFAPFPTCLLNRDGFIFASPLKEPDARLYYWSVYCPPRYHYLGTALHGLTCTNAEAYPPENFPKDVRVVALSARYVLLCDSFEAARFQATLYRDVNVDRYNYI
jgi:hypothetical protein